MIAFVGAIAAASATGAFFSDEETSTGNTFTAGAIDLLVDSQAHYAGLTCTNGEWVEDEGGESTRPDLIGDECDGTWAETDLGPTFQFFTLSDLKPGDEGENTLSLHVENNDAYMCAIIDNMSDDDLGLTEPEEEDGDLDDGVGNGELANELRFFAWADNGTSEGPVGNNVWDTGEPMLFSNEEGPASDVLDGVVYPMFTPETIALAGDTTTYVGLYWCYGDIEVDALTTTLTCDGEPVTNVSQTDQLTADISFYVEQARNNEGFECPVLELETEPT